MSYPVLQIPQSTRANGVLDVQQDCVVGGQVQASTLKLSDASGLTIKTTTNDDIIKFWGSNSISMHNSSIYCDNIAVDGNLTVVGSITGQRWVAGKVDGSTAGAQPRILKSKGTYGFACVRNPNQAVGCYDISWTTPLMVNGEVGGWSELANGSPQAAYGNAPTKFSAFFRKLYQGTGAVALVDCPFAFVV